MLIFSDAVAIDYLLVQILKFLVRLTWACGILFSYLNHAGSSLLLEFGHAVAILGVLDTFELLDTVDSLELWRSDVRFNLVVVRTTAHLYHHVLQDMRVALLLTLEQRQRRIGDLLAMARHFA